MNKMINLRMNPLDMTDTDTPTCFSANELKELGERIRVMKLQESTTYECKNYIERRRLEKELMEKEGLSRQACDCRNSPRKVDEMQDEEDDTSKNTQPAKALANMTEVDATCREKMCEWSYRVIDHFHAPRELVAVSLSYLDRFVDRCSTDRTAFKLAAITTLHLATKVFNKREICMSSLAELSRGEFSVEHIGDMEMIILQSLSWRMHPPTVCCFIDHFLCLLGELKEPIRQVLVQRAYFFSELAVFDYEFVTHKASDVALSAIANALEGLESSSLTDEFERDFWSKVSGLADMDPESESVSSIREKLWRCYRQSEQYKLHDYCPQEDIADGSSPSDRGLIEKSSSGEDSPVCVSSVNDMTSD